MGDQVEFRPVGPAQAEASPAHPDDEVRLIGALLAEPVQAWRGRIVAVANADLARDWRATVDRFGAMCVGHFQVREAAAAQVVDRVDPPVGAFAAALADVGAIAAAQAAPAPHDRLARGLCRELTGHHGVQEGDGSIEQLLQAGGADVGEADLRAPGRGFLQRQSAGTARQGDAQQVAPRRDLTGTLDGPGLAGEPVEIEIRRQAAQHVKELVRGERCWHRQRRCRASQGRC